MSNPDNESYQRKNVENKGFSVNLLKKGKLNFKRKNLLFLYNSKTFKQGQARKSVGRMTWHQEPKKDVTSCDKPRGGANIRYIRGFPNGGTRLSNTQASCIESNRCTRGTV